MQVLTPVTDTHFILLECSMLKTIHFYESNELRDYPEACTTYKDFKNCVRSLDVLHTNETSALSFEYFDYYDVIIIHTSDNNELTFYKPIGNGYVTHDTSYHKNLRMRPVHDLRRMFIAGVFN